MDPFWQDENSHEQCGFGPKVIVTGRLDGTLYGRPVVIEALDQEFVISIASVYSAWRARRSAAASLVPLLQQLREFGFRLTLHLGSQVKLEILPETHWAVRFFIPGLVITETKDVR